ncbi:MAG: TIGR01620 family protein [Hyphomicrobiaceae bacterium]|nr:TIGR01620 family protein [Hyphomicrobiaceae bacterium]
MTRNQGPRGPQVFDADDPQVRASPEPSTATPTDGSDNAPKGGATTDNSATPPSPSVSAKRTVWGWGAILFSTALSLATLAAGLWFTRFVSVAVERNDWLGLAAKAMAAIIVLALAVLLLKEVIGFFRLARLSRIRRSAETAIATQDQAAEKRAVDALKNLAAGRPETKWALARFRERERYETAPGARLGLADKVILEPGDKQARRIVFESARRVAVVTAVVPIAAISVLFILFENLRMIRRLAGAYGGRPGFFGSVRLLWRVIAYVAAGGAVILTDDLVGQFLGQDVVRRLSRRLGEGAFNGALTARLGVAAVELCRPLPYLTASPLRARHIVSELFPEFRAGDLVRGAFSSARGKRQGENTPPDDSRTGQTGQ